MQQCDDSKTKRARLQDLFLYAQMEREKKEETPLQTKETRQRE